MSLTYQILAGLLLMAGGLCVWALITGSPGPDWRQETARAPGEHTRKRRDQDTQRLLPPEAADWVPPWERPGGVAHRLPPHEDVLKAKREQE